MFARHRRGFTLVELLVVIAIIGILIGLLLPAVQAAREAARKAQCMSNVKQMALACLSHLSAQKNFPTGGWGSSWTGDPDRGFGNRQPGGWCYNILPFLEGKVERELGSGLSQDAKEESTRILIGTPQAVFLCPTRSGKQLLSRNPNQSGGGYPGDGRGRMCHNCAEKIAQYFRTDYAANMGNCIRNWTSHQGPRNYAEADGPGGFLEKNIPKLTAGYNISSNPDPTRPMNLGIVYVLSVVQQKHVTDGLSNTYLLGERNMKITDYESGDEENKWSPYFGHNEGSLRTTYDPPLQDTNFKAKERFGGPHAGATTMAMCDGSVQSITYGIDGIVHNHLGTRSQNIFAKLP